MNVITCLAAKSTFFKENSAEPTPPISSECTERRNAPLQITIQTMLKGAEGRACLSTSPPEDACWILVNFTQEQFEVMGGFTVEVLVPTRVAVGTIERPSQRAM